MIRKTLYFGNPAYLSQRNEQLVIRLPDAQGMDDASGLLPTLEIHHHNRYNAYALADDIMEPYRPFVDRLVCGILADGEDFTELGRSVKARLLTVPMLDVVIGGKRNPLMVAVGQTTASLAKCYGGTARKIDYPVLAEL